MKAAIIYMASGFGKRFGQNKLLALFRGRPLYEYGLETADQAARLLREKLGWQVSLTVVSQYEEILQTAAMLGAEAVFNPDSSQGITASLRLGTSCQQEDTQIYAYLVADQPALRPETLAGFLEGFEASGRGMGCVCCGGRQGNPAAFLGRYRGALMELSGDRGGSVLMRREPDQVWTWEAKEEELRDVDVPKDLERLTGGRDDGSTDREEK